MASWPSFTIVITTYNRLPLLKRAVASAIAQTVPCEVVIIDDQSTDETQAYGEQLAATHGDPERPVIYHRQPTNQGHSAAVNQGVTLARGDWVKPLDDDDYLAKDCIAQLQTAIGAHRDRLPSLPEVRPAVIASSQAAQVDPNGIELSRTPKTGPGHTYTIPQTDIHYGMLMEVVPFGTPAQVAFQRQAFIASGGWDSSLDTNCDDIDAWLRIAIYGDALFINDCLAFRTLWEGAINQTFSFQKRFETNWLIKEKIYRLIPPRHAPRLPRLSTLQPYLRLHWGLVALKQGRWQEAWRIGRSALVNLLGWQLFLRARLGRRSHASSAVRKIVLLDAAEK